MPHLFSVAAKFAVSQKLKNSVALLLLQALTAIGIILLILTNDSSAQEKSGWDLLPEILRQIHEPHFPDQDFLITDFGAVGDGKSDCKPAIDKAIQACVDAGGGRVVVPEGNWLVNGPIHLRSNVNLHLSANSTVLFSTNPTDYLPVVFTRFEGTELMNFLKVHPATLWFA